MNISSQSPKTFLDSAEQLFNATKADNYAGLHDVQITTNNQWDICNLYQDNNLSIKYPDQHSDKTWESMIEEQVYFLLLVAAAEGEL